MDVWERGREDVRGSRETAPRQRVAEKPPLSSKAEGTRVSECV